MISDVGVFVEAGPSVHAELPIGGVEYVGDAMCLECPSVFGSIPNGENTTVCHHESGHEEVWYFFLCGKHEPLKKHIVTIKWCRTSHVSYVDPGLDLIQVATGSFLCPHEPVEF